MRTILAIIALLALGVGVQYFKKINTSQRILEEMRTFVHSLPEYHQDSEYFDTLYESSHEFAFEQSYKMGGRRRGSKFDQDRYLAMLYGKMAHQAKIDGRMQTHDVIDSFRKHQGLPSVDFSARMGKRRKATFESEQKNLFLGAIAFLVGIYGIVAPHRYNLLRLKPEWSGGVSAGVAQKIPRLFGFILAIAGAHTFLAALMPIIF